jgi:hypothetical protein
VWAINSKPTINSKPKISSKPMRVPLQLQTGASVFPFTPPLSIVVDFVHMQSSFSILFTMQRESQAWASLLVTAVMVAASAALAVSVSKF